jgi:hypothetical protein
MIVFGIASLALGPILPLVSTSRHRALCHRLLTLCPGFGCSRSCQQRSDLFMGLHDAVQV